MQTSFLTFLAVLAGFLLQPADAIARLDDGSTQQEILHLVHPMIGVEDGGACFVGACLPFSLVRLGPDTPLPQNTSGHVTGRPIDGFSHTHASGAGGPANTATTWSFLKQVTCISQIMHPKSQLKAPRPDITRLDRTLKIMARNTSDRNKYIVRASLNGQEGHKSWFQHKDIAQGAVLELEMGPGPTGRGSAAPPPSVSGSSGQSYRNN